MHECNFVGSMPFLFSVLLPLLDSITGSLNEYSSRIYRETSISIKTHLFQIELNLWLRSVQQRRLSNKCKSIRCIQSEFQLQQCSDKRKTLCEVCRMNDIAYAATSSRLISHLIRLHLNSRKFLVR